MLYVIIVEGYNDFHFFKKLFLALKNFSQPNYVKNLQLHILYNVFFKNIPTKSILQINEDFVLLIQGCGKDFAIDTFIFTINRLITSSSAEKILLIVDSDSDPKTNEKIMSRIEEIKKNIRKSEVSKLEPYKKLSKMKMMRSSREVEAGIINIDPSLEQFIRDFIRDYSVIPKSQVIDYDPDKLIKQAIDYLSLKNFEGLSSYIFDKKKDQIKEELDRRCMLDTICQFF